MDIKEILTKMPNFNQNKLISCPHDYCPFIPFMNYFDGYLITSCKLGHKYKISLINYFQLMLSKESYTHNCNICKKRTSEFYCESCLLFFIIFVKNIMKI